MLHVAMKAVDIALLVLPALFALMIAHDFILYVQAQRQIAKSTQVSAQPTTRLTTQSEPTPAPMAKVELQQPAIKQPQPVVIEQQPEPLALPDLSQLKLYKLHGQAVVMIEDLPMPLPALKAYRLRGKECVRLADLETMTTYA